MILASDQRRSLLSCLFGSFTPLGYTTETHLIIQRGKSGLMNQKRGKKKSRSQNNQDQQFL